MRTTSAALIVIKRQGTGQPSSGHLTEPTEIAKFVFIWGLRVSLKVIGELSFINSLQRAARGESIFKEIEKKNPTNVIQ